MATRAKDRRTRPGWIAAASLLLATGAQAAGTPRFGLEFGPDTLDPARSGS